jgi:chorismate--pyruvate lyase
MVRRETSIPASLSLPKSYLRKTAGASRDDKWQKQLLDCPPEYREWLGDRGSLTARIQDRCESFRVNIVYQGLAKLLLDEAGMLGLRPREIGIVREVQLFCGNRPVVFAHTILRKQTLRRSWNIVSGLGNRSLGSALFADPRIKRLPLRYKKLTARDRLFNKACNGLKEKPLRLWARRSLFVLKGQPLLVTEIFLPWITKLKK